MYIKLNEEERDRINQVMEITYTDYEPEGYYIKGEKVLVALEDLLMEYKNLQQELEDFKQNVKDNYKQIPYEHQI